MSDFKQSQIIAALQRNSPSSNKHDKNKGGSPIVPMMTVSDIETNSAGKSRKPNHGITVTATGEVSELPDRCRLAITIHAKKAVVEETKSSVTRRLDYVTQALHNHHVKDSNIKVVKTLQREDGMFLYSAEVLATFTEAEKCQDFCNLLVEKLDDNVRVSMPQFFHSPQKIESLRRQACLLAVGNAKEKASEISAFLNTSLGKPVNVQEESCSEWEGSDDISKDTNVHLTFHQRYNEATFNVTAKIAATFELKSSKNSAGISHT